MPVEIPECTRCCVCLPLRCGVIILGYLKLVISILQLLLEFIFETPSSLRNVTFSVYRGMGAVVDRWCVLLLFTLDIVFTVTLVIGAHKKRPSLMNAYYYYGVATALATLVTYVLLRSTHRRGDFAFYVIEASIVFCGFILEVYLVLLVRSELRKLRRQRSDGFVNPLGGCMDPPNWPHMSDRPISASA